MYYKIKGETLSGIADAIRVKNGTSDTCNPMEMAAAISQMESGGAKLNIAYGTTAPEDTAMLWVKTATPTAVKIQPNVGGVSEKIETGIGIIPAAASGIATAAVGTNVYLFGGYSEEGRLDTIYTFDTKTNTLTKLETVLPVAMNAAVAVTVGKKVYLFGGSSGSYLNTIQVFDSETNTISTLSTTLTRAACRIGAAAVGTNVYLFGGQATSGKDMIQVFNTETNALTTLSTTLPTVADSICTVTVGTKIYLLGGMGNTRLQTILEFDTETNTISTMGAMISGSMGCAYQAAAAIGTKIYLFGGRRAVDGNRTDAIAVYDPENDTLAALDTSLPGVMDNMGAAAVGTSVYLFGGDDGDYLNTIHKFAAAFDLPNNHILMEMSLTDNLFELIAEGEVSAQIGIANVYRGNEEGVGEKVPAALYVDGAWTEV